MYSSSAVGVVMWIIGERDVGSFIYADSSIFSVVDNKHHALCLVLVSIITSAIEDSSNLNQG